MADALNISPIWCDVGKNVNSVYLVVSLKDVSKRKIPYRGKLKLILKINSRFLICESYDDGLVDDAAQKNENFVLFPVDFTLLPKSCSGLTVCGGNELQMRLSFTLLVEDSHEELSNKRLKKELNELRNGHHSVCCRMCGSSILSSKIHFKRVLELPSENWLDLAQDWCCHGSSHLTSLTGGLQPNVGDCLVGDHYITLHPSALEPANVILVSGMENDSIKCSRCNGIVGYVAAEDSNVIGLDFHDIARVCLYKHTISLKGSELFRLYSTEQFLSSCLLSKSRGAVNFRFLVQHPSENGKIETCALLWLFNADTAVVTNVELENKITFMKTEQPSVCNKAKYLRVLKVLYKLPPQSEGSGCVSEVEAWQQNPSVQSLVFTQNTCLQLMLLLRKSSYSVPPSLREMNGFKVGYLRTLTD